MSRSGIFGLYIDCSVVWVMRDRRRHRRSAACGRPRGVAGRRSARQTLEERGEAAAPAMAVSPGEELAEAARAGLHVDVLLVPVDGARADLHGEPDLLRSLAVEQALRDPPLLRGELVDRDVRGAPAQRRGVARRAADCALDGAAVDLRDLVGHFRVLSRCGQDEAASRSLAGRLRGRRGVGAPSCSVGVG